LRKCLNKFELSLYRHCLIIEILNIFISFKLFIEMAFEFTDANFKSKALDNQGVTVVDFWAEWCGPCKMIGPVIEELSHEYEGKATIGKMDVDNNQEVPFTYGVRAIPTILIMKNGQVVDKQVGVTTKQALKAKIEAAMA
jgi:thioredoxin 1